VTGTGDPPAAILFEAGRPASVAGQGALCLNAW
jgi:hypothetical protein